MFSCEIIGSQRSEDFDVGLPGCDTMWTYTHIQTVFKAEDGDSMLLHNAGTYL
jgi:hypothetical protein